MAHPRLETFQSDWSLHVLHISRVGDPPWDLNDLLGKDEKKSSRPTLSVSKPSSEPAKSIGPISQTRDQIVLICAAVPRFVSTGKVPIPNPTKASGDSKTAESKYSIVLELTVPATLGKCIRVGTDLYSRIQTCTPENTMSAHKRFPATLVYIAEGYTVYRDKNKWECSFGGSFPARMQRVTTSESMSIPLFDTASVDTNTRVRILLSLSRLPKAMRSPLSGQQQTSIVNADSLESLRIALGMVGSTPLLSSTSVIAPPPPPLRH